MQPDPESSIARKVLEELIEEGSEAFAAVLAKLLKAAIQLERSEFLNGLNLDGR